MAVHRPSTHRSSAHRDARDASRPGRAGRVAAVGLAAVLAVASALGGAVPASAAPAYDWGSFTVQRAASGAGFVGTMTLDGGFPATSFTTNASGATAPSGASVWQADGTPPGAVYQSSRGQTYLNLRPLRNNPTPAAASVTTYAFDGLTPSTGWSFVLGDIDADQATIAATGADGLPVATAALGFQGVYNYCRQPGGPSCDPAGVGDVPRWDETTSTLIGNPAGSDTEGASGWFSPSVPLSSLTVTYQQRVGSPVYQTWFATRTSAASGIARSTVDGTTTPYAGGAVTVTDASGRTIATTTTDADGAYTLPALTAAPGYTVTITPPDGADGATSRTFSLVDGDRADLDFAFTTTTAPEPATVDITGTITDETGDPVADTPIEIIPADEPTAPDVSTTTDDTGTFDAPGLAPETDYTIIVDGDTDRPIEFTTPALDAPNPPLELALPDAPVDPTPATVDITGTITDETGDPVADTPIEIIPADEPTAPDVSTTTDDTGTFDAPGLAPETDYTIIVDGDTDRPIEFTTPALDAPNPPLDLALPDAPVDPTPATVDVTGTITDETGDPVADTPIEIIPADEPTAPDVSTTTDDTGAFDAPGLAPETDYTIIVDGDTDRPIEFTTPALDAPNPPLELALPDAPVDPTPEPTPTPTPEPTPTPVPATVSVDGTVSDILGAPVTDAPVEVLPVESADVVAASTTDASGAFVVDGLAPDTDYRLFVDGYSVAVFTTGADDVSLGSLILVRGVVPTPDDPIGGPSVGGPGTGLAFTGSDTGAPIGVAAGLVALGLVLTAGAAVRRRRAAVEERE
ncbi:carboxypeptidase-like regulatory domain-containing protein [Frigoribacterium faeni]|uniref:Protocatechuate 3,4-dioxygenase beta subunit n=2 Tax=Frigoribacterium faeni TaxID=145483 RepID=A0A7W3JFY6_9MICO|nr:carboxypeptidase-like regulatory domain-containing protein [Frigoribacterium faeni]MBA8812080.1 protocatechuate 3,4-dioxygenase beta subunit [Frigoribacterium faeni]